MEKRTPHFPLSTVFRLMDEGRVRTTKSAQAGAADMGISPGSMLSIVRSLEKGDFVKSMTTYADHRIWQDVYCPMTASGRAYVKITVMNHVAVVSFKEWQS